MAGVDTLSIHDPSHTMYELDVPERHGQTREELIAAAFALAIYADFEHYGEQKPHNVSYVLGNLAVRTTDLIGIDTSINRLLLWDTMNDDAKLNGLVIKE